MFIGFKFMEDCLDLLSSYDHDLDEEWCKGITIPSGRGPCYFINLSAKQWSFYKKLKDDDYVISKLGQSIVHEVIHCLIREDNILNSYTIDGEEEVCRLMAGQQKVVPNQNQKL